MQPGAVVAGRFEIERLAGTGGMAYVYRARDRATNAVVAVKILHESAAHHLERFVREIDVLAALSHPTIVHHIAHGTTDDDRLYLAMEWLEGETLAERMKRGGMAAADGLELVRRVAEGLGAAHQRGIVHRDIKPSNLVLEAGDPRRPRIVDFGIARVVFDASQAMTRTGVMIGTPGYMAPEQAKGARGIDARADVFSLGCVLFECLTGRQPFTGENFMAILAKIVIEDVPRVRDLEPGVAPALDALVARMLAKDPNGRPRDGGAVAAEIAALGDVGRAVPSSRERTHADAITVGEQRVLTVVLANGADFATPTGTAILDTGAALGRTVNDVRIEVERTGGRFEYVLGGSWVATFVGRGAATDQAAQAARAALTMRALLPGKAIAVATGRATVATERPAGEAIDRAAELLSAVPASSGRPPPSVDPALMETGRVEAMIFIDDTTAGLLDTRFEVVEGPRGFTLVSEREGEDVARMLLGKVVPCIGRERELGQLNQAFEECVSEPLARAVLITAPPGMGKSRIRYEFVRSVQARTDPRVEVWIARGDPVGGGSAFGLLGQALRRAAGIRAGEPVEVRRRKLRARVARNMTSDATARAAAFIGEIAGVPFAEEAGPNGLQLRAARDDPRLMGDQMRRAFEDFVTAECNAQPLLFVLEDLQWGDSPTVQLVDAALRRASELPFFVLALARPEARDVFPRLFDERGVIAMSLRELKPKSAEAIARAVLGEAAAPELVADMVERAAGNAFYLEELLRAVARGASHLPDTVLAMVETRLESLNPGARKVMRAASVFGRVFWGRGAAALLGGGDETHAVTDPLSELLAREIVQGPREGRFPDEPEYVFRHALVRDAAYAMLTDDDRRLGHRLAGAWLRAAGETDAMVLAEHFEKGGENAHAVEAFRRATSQALEGNDLEGAIARAERGVACGASGEALGELRLAEAEASLWLARHDDASHQAQAALELLRADTAAWFSAASVLAEAAGRTSEEAAVVWVAERLHRAVVTSATRATFASAGAAAVAALLARGRYDDADRLLDKLGRLGEQQDAVTVAWVLNARSWRLMMEGDLAACLDLDRQVAECFDSIGDLRRACEHRANVAYDMTILGAYAEAAPLLREAIAIAERMGLAAIAAGANHNLGQALARSGDLEEGERVERAAVDAYAAQGNRRMEGASRMYLTAILTARARLDDAEREARCAVELLEVSPPYRVQAMATVARTLTATGRNAEALVAAREAHEGLEALGGIGEGEPVVRLAYADALLAAGDTEGAARILSRARARVLAAAEKIGDPIWRASFLTRVPENARILELAQSFAAT